MLQHNTRKNRKVILESRGYVFLLLCMFSLLVFTIRKEFAKENYPTRGQRSLRSTRMQRDNIMPLDIKEKKR